MKNKTPFQYTDSYKLHHAFQYPEGTELVFSNFTPRKGRVKGADRVVLMRLSAALRKLVNEFQENFFNLPKTKAVDDALKFYTEFTGVEETKMRPLIDKLHDHGKLPITVVGIKEGLSVPYGVPKKPIFSLLRERAKWSVNKAGY